MVSNPAQDSYKLKLAGIMGSSGKNVGFRPDGNLTGCAHVTNKKVGEGDN